MKRPSASFVVAVAALVIASGGSATAATLITGKQIKDSTVTTADIRNGSLTGTDLKDASLRGADVANGSLTAADLAAGTVLRKLKTVYREVSGNVSAGSTTTITMTCAPGEVATGGGSRAYSGVNIVQSVPAIPTEPGYVPVGPVTGWKVYLHNTNGFPLDVYGYVVCASLAP